MSKVQIRYVDGVAEARQSDDGGKTWKSIPVPEGVQNIPIDEIVNKYPNPYEYTGKPSRKFLNAVNAEIGDIDRKNQSIVEKINRGPESQARTQIAKEIYDEMPWYKSVPTALGIASTEKIKDMASGVADFADFGIDAFTPGGSKSAMRRSIERYKKRDERRTENRELLEQSPISTFIGGGLPYLAIDAAIAPNIAIKGLRALSDPMNDLLSNTIKHSGTGALGGAMDTENTTAGGAIDGGIGGVLGTIVGRRLERSRNLNDDSVNETVEWWKKKGYTPDAGMRTGFTQMQRDTSALRKNPKLNPVFEEYDKRNNAVVMRVAGDAIGMDTKGKTAITDKMLKEHYKRKGDEFDSLENGIMGQLDPASVAQIRQHASVSDYGNHNNSVNNLLGRLENLRYPNNFHPVAYKELKNDIKRAMQGVSPSSPNFSAVTYDTYKGMLDSLEQGFRRGMTHENSARYSKLQEEYAMTEKLISEGLTPNGLLDMRRISNHMLNDDARNMLRNTGGNSTNFHMIARLNEILEKQADAGLNSVDNTNPGFFRTPAVYDPGVISRARVAAEMSAWPTTTGLLNAKRGSTVKYMPQLIHSDAPDDWQESMPGWLRDSIYALKGAKKGAQESLGDIYNTLIERAKENQKSP